MTISLKHSTSVAVPDNPAYPVGSSEYNAEHLLTLAADRVMGRLSTPGAVQELANTDIANFMAGAAFSASAYALTAAAINSQTGTTYTLQASDNGKVITLNNAAAISLICPSGLAVGFSCMIIQFGVGQVGVTAGSGASLQSFSSLTHLVGRYAMGTIIMPLANTFILGGQIA